MKSDAESNERTYDVVGVRQLTEEQAKAARALRELCNRSDGLDLKVGISTTFVTPQSEPYAFLCTVDGALVGFCTLTGDEGPELELCGMVHPAYRRRGIGRALLRAALESTRRRLAVIRVLAICEDASTSGRAFIAAVGGKHSSSENRMETTTLPPAHSARKRLDIRPAGPDEAPILARVIGEAFGQTDGQKAEDIIQYMATDGDQYYLAQLGKTPVGAFKVFVDRPKAYIYALGVLPAYRRRGYGREILEEIVPRLFREGWTAVGLEVDADNAPALALYRSVGFHDVTVYGYYELAIAPL